MNYLELRDLRNGYVDLCDWVQSLGRPVTSRGLDTVELTGVTLEFRAPTGVMLPLGVGRGINTRLAAVEALQLLSGTGDVALLRRASPQYTDVLVDPAAAAYGAYGPRLRAQLTSVIELLRRDPTTRRAVLSIWSVDDLTHDGDRPCTIALQFLVRNGRLELVVSMRSQDVWLGVPYDVFMFTQLQRSLARQLGVGTGRYVHHVGSLHLYDRDSDSVGRLRPVDEHRPPPADYPAGVDASFGDTFVETAVALVEGAFDLVDTQHNAWYVRQLAALGVGSPPEETTP